ncbi:Ccc1 family [Hyaloscypha finlandica]|nr:Ccc1 family [Hyaloscypha finlandica]
MSSSHTALDPTAEPRSELAKQVEQEHAERHSSHGEVLRDIILGVADGLTVPFALTAGLSSLGSSNLVVIGGLAELFSGAISMGLGAYLAAVSDSDHYDAEYERERREVERFPKTEEQECYEILEKYNIPHDTLTPVIKALVSDEAQWIQFMMDFELKLEKPKWYRKYVSALTMGLSYLIGGLIPMIPYFAMSDVTHALFVSIGITAVVLLVFGYIKNWVTVGTKRSAFYGAFQTLIVGAAAAGTSYGIVRGLDNEHPVATQ